MKTYTILVGQFRQEDGTLLGAGQTIELEDDVAAMHAGRIAPVEAAAAPAAPAAEET